jgi:predicted lipoprotein with Yx(FWY)xxD motif
MKQARARNFWVFGFGLASPLFFGMASCQSEDGGLALPNAGRGGSGSGAAGGMPATTGGTGGTDAVVAGSSGELAGAAGHDEGTSGTGGGSAGKAANGGRGGTGGSHQSASGGSGDTTASGGGSELGGTGGTGSSEGGMAGATQENGGEGNTTAAAGAGGSPDQTPQALCIFHGPPSITGGGEGGAAPAPGGVLVATNAFVGPYLTDQTGLTLYIYGADFPGDCKNPPVSNCVADCTQSWPIFDAGERVLDPSLDAGVFGTIDRGGGVFQTTYYGWPLYRYKSDTTSNAINGQGKGKTWFAAEVELPNLMIMRGPVDSGGVKYLSDDHGRTLYALSGDTLGGPGVEPGSACSGDCLAAFVPFAPGAVYPVTSIEPHDVGLFFRADGTLQTAYKGAPLYLANSDLRSGQTNGLALFGGALVVP